MSRPIINADEHMRALSKKSRTCILHAVRYLSVVAPHHSARVLHLYPHDIDRITGELRGCGYDLGRGFKICGAKVVAAAEN